MRLSLAQLRALVALAEQEAATGVYVDGLGDRVADPLLVGTTSTHVVSHERWRVWADGAIAGPLDPDGRPLHPSGGASSR